MDYDKRAVGFVRRLERAVPPRERIDFDHLEIGALFSALEVHLENGGLPEVVQAYESVFFTLATLRGVDPTRIKKATGLFRELQAYLRKSYEKT